MEMEFSTVPGFSKYRVGEDGTVKNGTAEPLKDRINCHGYRQIDLINDAGERKTRTIHTLVLEAFTGPRPGPEYDGAHEDGNKLNCHRSNLLWKTKPQNGYDRSDRHFTSKPGEMNSEAKLSNRQARIIAHIGVLGTISATWVANLFAQINQIDYTDEAVLRIWRKQSWKKQTKGIKRANRLIPQRGRRHRIDVPASPEITGGGIAQNSSAGYGETETNNIW